MLLRQQYEAGLKSVLEFAGDLMVDIPKVWDYLGELIGKLQISNLKRDDHFKPSSISYSHLKEYSLTVQK